MSKILSYFKIIASCIVVLFMFFIITNAVINLPTGYVSADYVIGDIGSCANSCGQQSQTKGSHCYCDNTCQKYGDCCTDFKKYC